MKPTELYIGEWPPPESAEHAGTGSADESWPPPDPDNLSDEADPDDGAWYAPAPKHPKHQPLLSGPMQCLQKIVDRKTDDELRAWRANGLDLPATRWGGVLPEWWGGKEPA